jgi:hypothetical protein
MLRNINMSLGWSLTLKEEHRLRVFENNNSYDINS